MTNNTNGQRAAKGGVAIAGAKVYFILIGLVQQIALKHLFGLSGYGAYSTASSIVSITYNPLNQTSVLGVSREVAASTAEQTPSILRKLCLFHGALSTTVAAVFALVSGRLADALGAPHISKSLLILSVVLFAYGFYAPLIGYLNGQQRFGSQATLDVIAATLRTIGLLTGLLFFGPLFLGSGTSKVLAQVEGAFMGFALASVFILAVALLLTGIGEKIGKTPKLSSYARFMIRVLGSQILLNLLFQADALILRRFASDAAAFNHLSPEAADPLVGAYRAAQLFCFLPYQLLMSVTFILFPLLASSWKNNEKQESKGLILSGTRIALLLAGLMVAALVGNPKGLISLVYGADAALLGAEPMRILAFGLGAFGVMGVLSSALTSLGEERRSLKVVFFSTLLVGVLCWLLVDRTALSPSILLQTAIATSSALLLGTTLAAYHLHKVTGAAISLRVLIRTIIATLISALACHLVAKGFHEGIVGTFLSTLIVPPIYLFSLVISRELNSSDLERIKGLFQKQAT